MIKSTKTNLKRGKSVRHASDKQTKLVKKKVLKYGLIILIIFIIYFLFFSFLFRIKYIKIVGNDSINTQEIEEMIWQATDNNVLLIFNRNNYWLLSTKYLLKTIGEKYAFENITIKKEFPNTVSLHLIERMGRLVWKTGSEYYVVDNDGIVTRRLYEMSLVANGGIPVTIDKNAEPVIIGGNILSEKNITSMLDAYDYYKNNIDRPGLKFDRFEMDDQTSHFYKIITRDNLEIHLNAQSSAEAQLSKLKRVVDTSAINFANLSYINLRVTDQVIYK